MRKDVAKGKPIKLVIPKLKEKYSNFFKIKLRLGFQIQKQISVSIWKIKSNKDTSFLKSIWALILFYCMLGSHEKKNWTCNLLEVWHLDWLKFLRWKITSLGSSQRSIFSVTENNCFSCRESARILDRSYFVWGCFSKVPPLFFSRFAKMYCSSVLLQTNSSVVF